MWGGGDVFKALFQSLGKFSFWGGKSGAGFESSNGRLIELVMQRGMGIHVWSSSADLPPFFFVLVFGLLLCRSGRNRAATLPGRHVDHH